MATPLIVDANVFKSYYDVLIKNITSSLTACPTKIFENLGTTDAYVMYLDTTGIIKQEWSNLVDYQWFNIWYADKLILAHFELVEPCKDNGLETKLTADGFPRKGRDWTYIRVTRQVANQQQCILATEDIDFYEPSQKGCPAKTRRKILLSSSGKVAKTLKNHAINVKCVASC